MQQQNKFFGSAKARGAAANEDKPKRRLKADVVKDIGDILQCQTLEGLAKADMKTLEALLEAVKNNS